MSIHVLTKWSEDNTPVEISYQFSVHLHNFDDYVEISKIVADFDPLDGGVEVTNRDYFTIDEARRCYRALLQMGYKTNYSAI